MSHQADGICDIIIVACNGAA
jgi:hypothetical protein